MEEEGNFLSSIKSRAITNNYLQGILNGGYLRFFPNHILDPPNIKKEWSKIYLPAFIYSKFTQGDLGFGPDKMLDRGFLQKIAYTLEQNLDIFTGVRPEDPPCKIAFFIPRAS